MVRQVRVRPVLPPLRHEAVPRAPSHREAARLVHHLRVLRGVVPREQILHGVVRLVRHRVHVRLVHLPLRAQVQLVPRHVALRVLARIANFPANTA